MDEKQREEPPLLHRPEEPPLIHRTEEEEQPLIYRLETGHHKIYWTRWYVMAMVVIANIFNNNLWAYWGPIAQSAKIIYGWTDTTIFILSNLGNAAGFLSTFAGCYFVDRKGIRVSILVCYAFIALTTATKIITTNPYPATILIGFGQASNGVVSSVTGAIPPAVSEVWFPLNERATATAIAALASGFGAATSFIIGPLVVSMPVMNGSTIIVNETDASAIRSQLMTLNYAEFGVSVALLLASIIYLPAKPPTPPSFTAACNRYDFKQGVLTIIKRPSMWHVAIMYGVAIGSYGAWSSVLDIVMNPLGITQKEAGWIGFWGGIAGILGGIVMGLIADYFKRRMKILLIIDCIAASLYFGWFACQCSGVLPMSTKTLYAAAIGGSLFTTASTPLFIEMACETSYPIGEGVTAGFLSMIINLTATVFMLINLIPHIGTEWMTWWVSGILITIVLLILPFKVRYQKVDIDSGLVGRTEEVN